MVLVQIVYGGSNILVKVALEKGLNQLVFVVYRHIIATLLLGSLAYVIEKRKQGPSLSFSAMMVIFVLASLGTTIHLNVFYIGIEYTSATVATALNNVVPTILLPSCTMEKVEITDARGQAKVLGTVICIGGSLIFTFWNGGYQLIGFETRPLRLEN
ncbi:WAT1-related protein At5g07050-like [Tripterygium wilfordii]|uniref:WAT1-related protein At5g07050-like n=1 Tax=Tripterygium wilfordii TaxID=458696 RepID=UPI0018F8530F|nr:WAT1-related protein At5g07050-like [Tripterygium wilfordii]